MKVQSIKTMQNHNILDTVSKSVSYGVALLAATSYGLWDEFIAEYGIVGDWEDPEDGSPIGIDVGELTTWFESHK